MIGWYILGGIVLLLLAIWLLRVSVEIAFGQELRVTAKIGPKKLTLLPKPEKRERAPKKKKKKAPAAEKKTEDKGKKKFPFTFEDIRSAAPVVFSITFAGDDPAKVAEMYGWANTAMWTMMPPLEQLIHIPDPHIHLGVDYNSFRITAEGRVGVRFRIGDLIVIALTLAVPVLKWYMNRRKKAAPQKEETKTV